MFQVTNNDPYLGIRWLLSMALPECLSDSSNPVAHFEETWHKAGTMGTFGLFTTSIGNKVGVLHFLG